MVKAMGRKSLEPALCILMLALAPLLALAPVLLGDSIPLSLDDIYFQPPWEEARPPEAQPFSDVFSALHSQRIYPDFAFLSAAASGEHSLLWNPQEALGMPFFALWRTRVLSPFSLPFYFMPLFAALRLSFYLKLLVAGWAAYYAGRRFGFAPSMSLFIGLTFQLSSPILLGAANPMADAAPWFPLLLVCAELLLLGQSRTWPFMAVVLTLMALAGSPEMLVVTLLWLLLYFVLRRLTDPLRVKIGAAGIAVGCAAALAAGLAAVQILPFIEFVYHSTEYGLRDAHRSGWRNFLGIVLPNYASNEDPQQAGFSRLFYIGFPHLLLLALWFSLRRFVEEGMRRRVEAFLLSAIALVLLPLLLGPGQDRLPLFSWLSPQNYFACLALAFALLAATAAEEWPALDPDETKASLARLMVLLPVLWGLVFLALTIAAIYTARGPAVVWPHVLTATFVGLAVLALLIITLLQPRVRLLGYSLSFLALLSLSVAFVPALPKTAAAHVFPETSFIDSLKKMDTRIGGSDALAGWPLSVHGIQQVYAVHRRTLERYHEFMEEVKEHPLLLRRAGAQALLLTKEDIQGPFASVRPVLNIQEVYPTGAVLLRDLESSPRARVIYQGRTVQRFDPEELDPQGPPLLEGTTLPEQDNGARARAVISNESNDRQVVIKVEKTRPGVLVLADSWYPGWKASVDGVVVPTYPVDGAFRGVELPEGEHEVVFRYAPSSLKIGLAISLASLFVLLWQWRQPLRRRLLRAR